MIDFTNGQVFKLKIDTSMPHKNEILPLLIKDEEILAEYKSLRDYVVFTTKRIITVNVQGITGKKKDYSSLQYSKIQAFSVETAGTLDLGSELELYFSGLGKVKLEFVGESEIVQIGRFISRQIL